MGITRAAKVSALATAILLMGLIAAACGGAKSGSGNTSSLVPQRSNLVGSFDLGNLLDSAGVNLDQVSQLLSSNALSGAQGLDDLLSNYPTGVDGLISNVNRVDIFGDADATGDSRYFGVGLYGSFNETDLIGEIESISGSDLVQEVYKGLNVYSPVDNPDNVKLSILDSSIFAIGADGALNDMIDIWAGDAESASGPLMDALDDLGGGMFSFAFQVPEGAFAGDGMGAITQLSDLPISTEFLSALEFLGLGGQVNSDSVDFTVNLDFSNQDAAASLEGFISGIVSLAAGFSSDQRTSDLLAGMEIDQNGNRLTIKFGIPKSELTGLFGDLTTITDTTTSGGFPPGTPEMTLSNMAIGEEVALMPSADHLPEGQAVQYSTTPPTSGMHWNRWADCGWYADGLPDEVITHNLEHGNIVVSYNFTNPAQVTELRQALEAIPLFQVWGVARSYDQIPDGQVAVSAWGRLGTYQGVAGAEIGRFFEAYAGLLGPERIEC